MRKSQLLSIAVLIGLLTMSATSKKKFGYKHAMKTLNGFCSYIPSGSVCLDLDTVSVQAFYMSETEITNLQYAEFLYHLKKNGETEKYALAAVDTNRWNTAFENGYNEPMAQYYHKHPAYHKYPVVNVTREGADLFCEWLSSTYDTISNGELKLKFRVPTRAEWLRAANGDLHLPTYSWGGPFISNAKGDELANYLNLGSEHITRDEETGKYTIVRPLYGAIGSADLTALAESYSPNGYGLYNMNGNVAEMISDGDFAVGGSWNSPGYDIRNQSIKKFKGAHPTVGFRIVATHVGDIGN
tara:strand:+ start:270 stop:1166 length:897 start_codon:yes stop_codon:yes gene_type:complete